MSGRPKGALSEAAKCIGINEQRVFEARQIRDANPRLYKEVKEGRRSLTSALTEINPPREDRFDQFGLRDIRSASEEFDNGKRPKMRRNTAPENGRMVLGAQKPAIKEAEAVAKIPPSHRKGSCSNKGHSWELVLLGSQSKEPDPKT
jgi:hypothetical protein